MIDELQVSNIALIREATLVPSAGLTVLTGETGAGKTALLSALKLIRTTRRGSPYSVAFLPRAAAASRLTAASPACVSFRSASA